MNILNTQGVTAVTSLNQKDDVNANVKSANSAKRYDTFKSQGEVSESVTYEPPKRLTQEQVNEIKRQQIESTILMMQQAISKNLEAQAGVTAEFELSEDSSNLLIDIFGSIDAAYPPPATTPEGAAEAIAAGGAYSVESVSERLLTMATYIAGDDPEMLAEMKEAVMQGFAAAGLNLETGEGMPQITMDTYNHVMEQFDRLLGVDA